MEPKNRRQRDRRAQPLAESDDLDQRYGLEPVFEPGADAAAALDAFVSVQCPYCWETYGVPIDLTAGTQTQIEDCQVCCQPIEFAIRVRRDGSLRGVKARRLE